MTGKQAIEYGMIASLIALIVVFALLETLPPSSAPPVFGHASPCGEERKG